MEKQQTLANDPLCEQAIVNILLSQGALITEAAEIINSSMFYNPQYGKIFNAIMQISLNGDSINIISVAQWLAQNENGTGIDETALIGIASAYFASDSLKEHCHRLRQLWQRRQLWQIGQQLTRAGVDEGYNIDDAKHDAAQGLSEIDKNEKSNILSAAETLEKLRVIVGDNRLGKRERGIATGFKTLDAKGGLQRSDLVVVAAEFSQGKTSLAVDLCVKAALGSHPCAFYSTEMTNEQLMARMMAGQSGVSARKIMQDPLTDQQMKVFDLAADITSPLPIFFDDTSTISIERIIVSIRRLVAKHKIELAFIDYLQVLQTNNSGGRQTEEQFFGAVARKLKNLAKELNICIVLISQLSRDKTTTEPSLSRLRGSGQIAEAADMVLLIYRPEVYGKRYSGDFQKVRPEGTALIRLAKGRNVGTADFVCGYDSLTTHFFELSKIPTTDQPLPKHEENERPF